VDAERAAPEETLGEVRHSATLAGRSGRSDGCARGSAW
jgi:hypothetical protein